MFSTKQVITSILNKSLKKPINYDFGDVKIERNEFVKGFLTGKHLKSGENSLI